MFVCFFSVAAVSCANEGHIERQREREATPSKEKVERGAVRCLEPGGEAGELLDKICFE